MRFRLEATPEELRDKSDKLIRALVGELADTAPDLSEALDKALPRKEPESRFPVLREIQKRTTEEYERMLNRMNREIGQVLDRGSMAKSLDPETDTWIELDDPDAGESLWNVLEKAGGAHKYIRRTPYTDSSGHRSYRYYYRTSAVARAAREGEDIVMGDRRVSVLSVHENGDITIRETGDQDGQGVHTAERVSASAWAERLAGHYGQRYYADAEKRARQAANAVLKHVPMKLLADLHGDDDAARMADLKTRVPDVYEKLQASFQRAGVNPFQAKQILADSLKRRDWDPGARAVVIGSVLTPEGASLIHRHREIGDAAENLAGGLRVGVGHAQAAIDLAGSNIARVAKRAESDLVVLDRLIKAARADPNSTDKRARVLAGAMAAKAVAQLNALSTAFPGLVDRAVPVARDTMLQVPTAVPEQPKRQGATAAVFVAGEGGRPKALKAAYRLVEAGDITPSHDPTSFKANGGYPENVQERAYHRDKSEQMKVIRNAKTLLPSFVVNTSPDAVNGPPLMTDDGIVLGGNSRTMSMQRVYADKALADKADELKAYMTEHAHEVGLNAADVKAMKQPILVRVVEVENRSTENLQVLVRQMNESFTQAMDPRTMQVAMGRRLDEQALQTLATNMNEGETLNSFLGTSRANGFISALYRAGVIDERNSNQYMVRGTKRLNADGKTLVTRVLAGRVLNDADLLSETKPSLVESVAGAVPYMVQASGYGSGYELSGSVQTALDAYNRLQVQVDAGALKALDAKISDREMRSLLDNQFNDMFGEKHPVLDDPRAQAMLELFIRRPGPKQMRNVFREYAKLAGKNPEGQEMLGVTEKLAPDQVFRLSIQAAIDKDAKAEAAEQAKKPKDEGSAEMFALSDAPADPAEPLIDDFTKPAYDRDELAYNRVKQVLRGKGYVDADFDEGGPLYGWSVNQLIDLARDKGSD